MGLQLISKYVKHVEIQLNKKAICKVNAVMTGGCGFALFSIVFSYTIEPIKFFLMFLIFPISYYVTQLYLQLGIRSYFLGYIVGGLFAIPGPAFLMLITSFFGKTSFVKQGGLFVWFFSFLISFIIGSISGFFITFVVKKDALSNP